MWTDAPDLERCRSFSYFDCMPSNFFQVPDFLNAKINGLPVKEVIKDTQWLEEEFTQKVQTVS